MGWGIQQAMQMTGTQLLGFASGEWRGVQGKPRRQMYVAIAILIVAAGVMAYGNTLTAKTDQFVTSTTKSSTTAPSHGPQFAQNDE